MPVKVVIATPSAPLSAYLQAVIASAHPDYKMVITDDWDAFTKYILNDREVTTVVADVIWGESNNYYPVRQYSLIRPHLGWMIVSPFDISGIVSRSCGIPAISAPQDEQEILRHLPMITEDRRGKTVGPYVLRDYASQSALGRGYKARHKTIDRHVTITIPPPNTTEADCELFRYQASVLGRISHPSIYTIYEIGEHDGQPFLAHEPVVTPTLLELQTKGETIDDRTLARILNRVGAAMNYIATMGLYSTPIELDCITLAKDGVVKLMNVAVGSDEGLLPVMEQLANLSVQLANMLTPQQEHHPALVELLGNMQNRAIEFADYVALSEQMEMALAPVKDVPVRREQVAAVAAIKATEKSRHFYILIGIPIAAVAIVIFIVLLLRTFAPIPGTMFHTQEKVTAGLTQSADPDGVVQLGDFYVDKYEVSIGQYANFLEKSKDMTIEQLLPDNLLDDYNIPNAPELLTYFRAYKAALLKYGSISDQFRDSYTQVADRAIKLRAFARAFGQFTHRNPSVNPKPELIPLIVKDAVTLNKDLLMMDFPEAKKVAKKFLSNDNTYRTALKAAYQVLQTNADNSGKEVDPKITYVFNQAGITIDTMDSLSKDILDSLTALEKVLATAKPVPADQKPIHAFWPDDWETIIQNAPHSNHFYKNLPITMDSPIFNVDFIDALAYAHSVGKRLLTESEWQRAAMGDDNRAYPWGNQKDPKRTNTGADFSGNGGKAGVSDGFVGWAPVNDLTQDVSPFGVGGMAGNVSEWTVFQVKMDPTDEALLNPKPPEPSEATTPAASSPTPPEENASQPTAKPPELPDEPAKLEDIIDPWVQIVRGGNYQEPLTTSKERRAVKFFTRHPAIGIRVGSTKPVTQ